MSSTIRLSFSGAAKRLLPAFLSSDASTFNLSRKDNLIKSYSSFSHQHMKIENRKCGISYSSLPKQYKMEKTYKGVKQPCLQNTPVRNISFSVATTLGAIKSANFDSKDSPSEMYFSTIDKLQHKNINFEISRRFSSAEKPTSTQSTSLADEIMQSKLKDASNEKTVNNEDPSENSNKGPTKWQRIGYWAFAIIFGGALVVNGVLFSLPDRGEDGIDIKDEFSELPFPSQYYLRLKNKIFKTKKDLEEPFSDKLLPDPLPEPYHQPKYTILLELTGLLVHSNWTHKHGWRFQKRPGVDIFVSQLGYPEFELVVYTTENAMTFYPIVDGLDPENKYIMYRLFRDATRYVDGHHTKDLFALNRDLKKVIVIDWDENTVSENRDNALILKKWEGDNLDRQLIGLTQLLQAIKQSDVDDVREVLRYYKQYDDPIEAFRENQRKLQETLAAEEQFQKEKKAQSQGGLFSSSLSSLRKFGR